MRPYFITTTALNIGIFLMATYAPQYLEEQIISTVLLIY